MPKRGENIRKRKDGRWEARILQENGKYKSVYADSYTAVKQKIKNTGIINIEPIPITSIISGFSFEELCNKWVMENETKTNNQQQPNTGRLSKSI